MAFHDDPASPDNGAIQRVLVTMTATEKLLLGVVAFALLMLMVQLVWLSVLTTRVGQQGTLLAETQTTTEENRAVSCRVLLSLGQDLDDSGPCFDPEVLAHYDPLETSETRRDSQQRTFEAICIIAFAVDADPMPSICAGGAPDEPR